MTKRDRIHVRDYKCSEGGAGRGVRFAGEICNILESRQVEVLDGRCAGEVREMGGRRAEVVACGMLRSCGGDLF